MLTNASVKAARAAARAYKLVDERGLFLHVLPSNTRSWRLRFRWHGKEQLLTIGNSPDLSLGDAREQAELARAELAAGRDPRARAYVGVGAAVDFETIARRWLVQQRRRWTEVHAVDVESSLVRDVFPAIGAMPIADIDAPTVLTLLRKVEKRDAIETARRLRQRISAVFALAMAEDLATANPAATIRDALLPPVGKRHQPALLELDEVRALLAAAELVDAGAAVKLASRFLALTAVRLAAVRGARWEEIDDLGGSAPTWRVPAKRMKMELAKKGDPRNDHLVPLSRAAVEVLRQARRNIPDHSTPQGLIFLGRGASAIGEAAIGALYARTRFAGRHVPHGWRASFSTLLNEEMPRERDAIDQALAHVRKDKVEAAYNRGENRAAQLELRRRIFDRWGEMLAPGA